MSGFLFDTRRTVLGLGVLAMALAASPLAHAAAAGDFYKGRTMFVIIGYAPGGGYDLYARCWRSIWANISPGNPTVIPQNMPARAV